MFCVLPSEKFPVAVNCSGIFCGRVGIAGVISTETSVAEVMVKVEEPLMPATVALMTARPVDVPFACPAGVTAAMDGADELQVADFVRSSVLPSA
jgi:hypothetical protein